MSLAIWVVLAVCAVAVVSDLQTRRIPNVLTIALAGFALVLHGLAGWASFGVALVILVGVMALGLVSFSLGWLGGGDVKLAAASAAALGYPDAVPFLVYMSLGGGVLALAFAAVTGRLATVLGSVALVLRPLAYKGTVPVSPQNPITLPYACAIAFGALAVALSHSVAPFLRLPI